MADHPIPIESLEGAFSICKVADWSEVDLDAEFCFVGKTDGERSLVCLAESVPPSTLAREDGWRALRVRGPLDFSLVGIIARISAVLAEAGIGIFVVSTFDTDYVLVREGDHERACALLDVPLA